MPRCPALAGDPDPLAGAAWLAELLDAPLTTEPDWTDPDPCAAWLLRHLADAATAPWQDPDADGPGDGTEPAATPELPHWPCGHDCSTPASAPRCRPP